MKTLRLILLKSPYKILQMIINKIEHLYYRFFYSKPKLNTDFVQKRYLMSGDDNLADIARTYRELFLHKVKDKITQADSICEHIFNLLGSGPKKLNEENGSIDWHSDFKSGYRWNPKTFYRNICYGHTEGVDIKVPWELSRFQHLNILGQAYILTGDNKYPEEFISQIKDWIMVNPVGFGVNWNCTMEVAIRAANWLVAMEYFIGQNVISQNFLDEFYNSIYEHAKFIRSHLERSKGLTTNHYLADIVGLFIISVYCPFFKEARKWQEFTLKELSNEVEKQTYPDGCNFEASTSYHRLALELFFYAELLGERAGIEFPKHYKDKVRKMFEFSLYCIKPNGMVPQIGDNDNGRFLIFAKRPVLEHKYLLPLAIIYYKDSEFKLSHFDFEEEAFWVFGTKGKELYDNLVVRKEPIASKSFPDAGWYIMRHNKNYCFISCGPNGQNGNGGHAHNDKLSFELMINGQDIVVDPGTYVYTSNPNERNKFRSTEYHNTVKFDNYEQNEISVNDIFNLPDRVKIKDVDLKETDDSVTFQGEIQYLGFTHKRAIILDKKAYGWKIIDNISFSKSITAKLIFHLSPEVYYNNGYIFSKKTDKKMASIEVKNHKLEKGDYDYFPEYGTKIKAECLNVTIPCNDKRVTINSYIHKL